MFNVIDNQTQNLIDKYLDESISMVELEALHEYFSRLRKRTFGYSKSFPAADTHCTTDFTRTFDHQDWVDGESVVQAEETSGEEGFNKRFHNIEDDLDALGAEVARAFVCLAEMRTTLSTMLVELRDEINRVNADIYECCQQGKGGYSYIYPQEDLQYVGLSNFGGKEYFLYKQMDQFIMMPKINPPVITQPADPTGGDRIRNTADLVNYLEKDPRVSKYFRTHELTREELVKEFGEVEVRPGVTVEEVVNILPVDKTYANVKELVKDYSQRNASVLTLTGEAVSVATFFGVGTDVATIEEAPIERMSLIPQDVGLALKEGGVDTLGKFANANTRTLVRNLGKAGVSVDSADVAAWQAVAQTFNMIH
jgi:hypothetical protein